MSNPEGLMSYPRGPTLSHKGEGLGPTMNPERHPEEREAPWGLPLPPIQEAHPSPTGREDMSQ